MLTIFAMGTVFGIIISSVLHYMATAIRLKKIQEAWQDDLMNMKK